MKKVLIFLGMVGVGAFLSSTYLARRRAVAARDAVSADLIDLNDASEEELAALMGIGPALALRILENRPYATKIDLIGRRVIPDANYEQIKRYVCVGHAA
jgi:DNA uptake protein ComE-like DNA-binding protein